MWYWCWHWSQKHWKGEVLSVSWRATSRVAFWFLCSWLWAPGKMGQLWEPCKVWERCWRWSEKGRDAKRHRSLQYTFVVTFRFLLCREHFYIHLNFPDTQVPISFFPGRLTNTWGHNVRKFSILQKLEDLDTKFLWIVMGKSSFQNANILSDHHDAHKTKFTGIHQKLLCGTLKWAGNNHY